MRQHRIHTVDGVKKCGTEDWILVENKVGKNSQPPRKYYAMTVNLAKRNPAPSGSALVNTYLFGQHDAMDLVSLAAKIQNADVALNNQSGKSPSA